LIYGPPGGLCISGVRFPFPERLNDVGESFAIVVRYGDTSCYELMIVDGGSLDSGNALVEHVRQYFGRNAVISHVVLTHADADHASGLRVVLAELVQLAIGRRITIQSPFSGVFIGPFRVLSPHSEIYTVLLPQFDRTPDPDQKAIEVAGWWVGKQPGIIARMIEKATAKAHPGSPSRGTRRY
jgi:glyoxylase-like metal-dependent hydrolase (beta-lactamase superfamily II)